MVIFRKEGSNNLQMTQKQMLEDLGIGYMGILFCTKSSS